MTDITNDTFQSGEELIILFIHLMFKFFLLKSIMAFENLIIDWEVKQSFFL